ncbi:MAG: thiamine biosynthesis protein [Flavobacteriales bacterium]|nr:MAG: thiamine biosynthesis protein [Flavobacteriales bacterium]
MKQIVPVLKNVRLWAVSIIIGWTVTTCKSVTNDYMHVKGSAQGTTFSIKYKSPEGKDLSLAIDSIFKVIDLSMSTYVPQSIISRINKGETDVQPDTHFINVFKLSQQVYRETNGYFDPSVGLLVNAYGFGSKELPENLKNLPTTELMTYTGFDKLVLENNRLIKKHPEIYIDFNSIAQGYSVDVIKNFLRATQIHDFMIEVGGEVYAQGKNPNGQSWQIGIQNPEVKAEQNIQKIVSLDHNGLATSGNYRKFKVDENGNKFVHTINPLTGKNTPSNLLSATVITSESCALADAYATAFMAMGFEKAVEFANRHPELDVYFIYVNDSGELQIFDQKSDI